MAKKPWKPIDRSRFEEWGCKDVIRNVQVSNLHISLRRAGYPKRVGPPDLTGLLSTEALLTKWKNQTLSPKNLNDVTRGIRLGALSGGHDNFLKGIIVDFDLFFSHALTPQLQRYHFIDVVSSQSKMHKAAAMPLDRDVMKWTPKKTLEACREAQRAYNENPNYDTRMAMIYSIPLGFKMWMGLTTNYLQLKTIYGQRKSDVLKAEWGPICAMIEDLPFFKEFVFGVGTKP